MAQFHLGSQERPGTEITKLGTFDTLDEAQAAAPAAQAWRATTSDSWVAESEIQQVHAWHIQRTP